MRINRQWQVQIMAGLTWPAVFRSCLSFVFFFAVILHGGVYAQQAEGHVVSPQAVCHRYSAADGLPSNTVYHVFQDSRGFIWFATNNGVSRFDGEHFENFDIDNGLVDNVVFEIYEDYKGRIWFVPFSCQLCYYFNGRIEPYQHNEKIKTQVNTAQGPVKHGFSVDTLNNLQISVKHFGLVSISEEGALRVLSDGVYGRANVVADARSDPPLVSARAVLTENPKLLFINRLGEEYVYEGVDYVAWRGGYQMHSECLGDSVMYVTINSILFELRGESIRTYVHPSDIIGLYADSQGHLWVTSLDGGVRGYAANELTEKPRWEMFAESQVASVLQDIEGAYWFATLYNGVYYVPDLHTRQITTQQGLLSDYVSALHITPQALYVGYSDAFVDKIQRNGTLSHLQLPDGVRNRVTEFVADASSRGLFVLGGGPLVRIDDNLCWACTDEEINIRTMVNSRDGGYWMGGGRHLVHVNSVGMVDQLLTTMKSNIWCLAEDCWGNLWCSTNSGLMRYDGDATARMGMSSSLLAYRGYDMFFHPRDSMLWLASNGMGVLRYDTKRDVVKQISRDNGLRSNTVSRMVYTDYGVWLATAQGISLVQAEGYDQMRVVSFTRANGIPDNEITALAVLGDTLVAGTSSGLVMLSISQLMNPLPMPPIHITDVKVNGGSRHDVLHGVTKKLKYKENALSISYVVLSYRNQGNTTYRYRMLGVDTAWSYTDATSCMYAALSPGRYTFQVQGLDASGNQYPEIASLEFSIARPFWQTPWFIVLLAAAVSGIFYALYRIRLRIVSRHNELIYNANMYKHQSLRQQMNPHFVFNTLVSIQFYILNNEPLKSQQYLGKFAQLMRKTLDNSEHPVVSLGDELEHLELYLYLEAIRLEGKFTYSITCPDLDQLKKYLIPTMLMQPFVENSIWHGIMLKQPQEGWVHIDIAKQDGGIQIRIDDNGVGRKQAQEIRQRSDHTSRGYQITQQRIELLGSMYGRSFRIDIVDKEDDQHQPLGTLVVIDIPTDFISQKR